MRWDIVDTTYSVEMHLLDDEPDVPGGMPELFEQRSIQKVIGQLVATKIVESVNGDFVIGIFGRFGQGKSRILRAIEQEFDRKLVKIGGKSSVVHCEKFDTSHYQANDLQENFDYFLEGRRVTAMAAAAIGTLLAIFYLALEVINAFGIENRLQVSILLTLIGAIVAAVFGLLASIRITWRDFLRSLRVGQLRKFFDSRIRAIWRGPRILIVDDLDRATLEQQKALLHSIRLHRGSLGSVVLVALNDQPLKGENISNHQFADEIFQKTFDAQVRLGPMNASDAAEMSYHFCTTLSERNRESSDNRVATISTMLTSPLFVGDVARIFYLHGNASARFGKKLINSVFSEAVRLEISSVDDLSALLRILGLYAFFPHLESDLDFFADLLNQELTEDLLKKVEGRLGVNMRPDRRTKVTQYLEKTSHMRPSHGTWKRVLRVWRHISDGNTAQDVDLFSRSTLLNWAYADALVTALDHDRERFEAYEGLVERSLERPRNRQIPRLVRHEAAANSTLSSNIDSKEHWNQLVARLKLYDVNWCQHVGSEAFLQAVKDFENHLSDATAPIVTKISGKLWTSAAGIIEHHSRLADDNLRLEDSLTQALSTVDFSIPFERGQYKAILRPSRLIVPIRRAWPSFGQTGAPIDHFERLREVLQLFSINDAILPAAHAIWLRDTSKHATDETIFDKLSKLVVSAEDASQFWPHATVSQAIDDPIVRGRFEEELADRLLKGSSRLNVWFAALLMFRSSDEDAKLLEDRLALSQTERVSEDGSGWVIPLEIASQRFPIFRSMLE